MPKQVKNSSLDRLISILSKFFENATGHGYPLSTPQYQNHGFSQNWLSTNDSETRNSRVFAPCATVCEHLFLQVQISIFPFSLLFLHSVNTVTVV